MRRFASRFRSTADRSCALKAWGMRLAKRVGLRKAKVAVRRAAQEERNRRTAVRSFRREPIEHLEQCIYLFHLHGEIAWCARPVFAEPRHEAYRPSWMVCR
jgi:hypothetical protein